MLETWDEFTMGNFLKAENVKSSQDWYAIVKCETVEQDGKFKLVLHLQRDEKDIKFTCNKTNSIELKKYVSSPKSLPGYKIRFEKIKQRDPTKNAFVDSLLIAEAVKP